MKYLTFILALTLSFAACVSDNKPAEEDQANVVTTEQNDTTTEPDVNRTKQEQFLLTHFWVFEYYIIPGNHPKSVEKRGTWYTFNQDGTFELGHWEEVLTKGTWTYFQEDTKHKIRCDAEDDSLDAEWELQFNQDGDVASWVGTSTYDSNKAVMGKVINLMTRPTKKQFGYE